MRGAATMLGWILVLAASCALSAVLGLGSLFPMASAMQGMFLTLTALLGAVLFAACDAFETRAVRVKADDED
jgi:hypothetical protein